MGKPGREWAEQGPNPRDLVLQGIIFDTVARLYPEFPVKEEQLSSADMGVDVLTRLLAAVEAWERALALDIVGTATITETEDTTFLSSRGEETAQASLDIYLQALLGQKKVNAFNQYILTTTDMYEFRAACNKWITLIKRIEELQKK